MRIGTKNITPAAVGRLFAAGTLALTLAAPSAAFAKDVRVMVDPGHGGKDPGAVSGGLLEKDGALTISKMIVESAKRQGWTVKMTRDTDKFINLNERPRKANAFKADAFVSIHSNSAGSKPTGHMTINRGGASKRLGDKVMGELAPLTSYEDIGNRADVRGLAVLRGAKVPAVIVELLSVSNAEERKALKDPAAQREMAEAVVRGIAKTEGVKYVPPVDPEAAKAPAAKPAAPKADATKAPAAKPAAAEKPAAPKADAPAKAATDTPEAKATKAPAKAVKQDATGFSLGNLWKLLFG